MTSMLQQHSFEQQLAPAKPSHYLLPPSWHRLLPPASFCLYLLSRPSVLVFFVPHSCPRKPLLPFSPSRPSSRLSLLFLFSPSFPRPSFRLSPSCPYHCSPYPSAACFQPAL